MIRISLFVILLVLGVIVQGQYIVSRQTDSEEGCSGDRIADTIALGGQCSSVSNISVYQTCSGSTITSYECSDSSCGNCSIVEAVQAGCTEENTTLSCADSFPSVSQTDSVIIYYSSRSCVGDPYLWIVLSSENTTDCAVLNGTCTNLSEESGGIVSSHKMICGGQFTSPQSTTTSQSTTSSTTSSPSSSGSNTQVILSFVLFVAVLCL